MNIGVHDIKYDSNELQMESVDIKFQGFIKRVIITLK